MPVKRKLLEQIIKEEYRKLLNEFAETPTATPQQTQNPYKISRKSTTAGQLAKVQRDQLKAAFGQEGQELSGLERTLIKDLEEKIRELASIPDVDLVKIRPRLEQMLKVFYKTFDSQIKTSQSQNNKSMEPNQTSKPQAGVGASSTKIGTSQFKPVKLSEEVQASPAPKGIQTFGDLKKVIDYIELKRKGNIAAPKVAQYLAGLVPGGGTAFQMVMDAKDTIGFLSSLYKADDNFTTQSGLDVLNVNDNISKIVDDKIETAFINSLYAAIERENPNTPIGNWNATTAVQQFLSDNFEQHTIRK